MTTTAAATNKEDPEPEEWAYQLFGCFDDPKLCIFTFLLPCYTIGRNSEAFEEDGVQVGVWYGLCCYGIGPVLRWRLRQKYNLVGNMISDVAVHTLCPCCSLIQENKQLYGPKGSHIGEKTPFNDMSMARQ